MWQKRIVLCASILIGGCTSITVTPLDAAYDVKHVCIRENPKVMLPEMVPVITEGLTRHNISSEFIPSTLDKQALQSRDESRDFDLYYMNLTPAPDHCEFSLVYTARRTWDVATYLSTADIAILTKAGMIAKAHYKLRNKGGLSLLKYQGVKAKIDPVMDELLQHY